MEKSRLKSFINEQEPTFLKAAKKKGYLCPVCDNGNGTTGDGIEKDPTDGKHFKCFKCGLYEDVLGLYGKAFGIEDFNETLKAAAEYYGEHLDQDEKAYQKQAKTEQKPEEDYTSFYREANKHLTETDYYKKRGLSLETCNRFLIGFTPEWKHPKAPARASTSPRLIIPISRYSYLARDTREEDQIPEEQKEYKKSKCKGKENVSWIFNRKALKEAKTPIFVTEGEINAMSIIECGGEAVAMGSTAYINAFVKALEEDKPEQALISTLDNDGAGQRDKDKLEKACKRLGIPFYRVNPAGKYNDVNDRLVADPAGLKEYVLSASDPESLEDLEQSELRREYLQNSAAAHLQEFIDGIKESANTPATPTGFKQLDEVLEGGLYEGLILLGAISSLGKTSFILQIMDQIAQSGQDVLFFSLEMARAELMSKSISRHTLQEVLRTGGDIRDAKTSRGITTGSRYANYSTTEYNLIQTAIRNYSQYADHVFISEGVGDIGVKQIRETVEKHISITGKTPIVMVDYLQILAPQDVRATDKQNMDRAVLELKRISRDYKTAVIAVSSFNRDNYKVSASMEAFKESGALEYSADVLLGLQLAGVGSPNFDVNEAKQKDPREVELVVLKNRSGKTGGKIAFSYYPMFNYFTEKG